jgi:EAL domain-containing protein (putative c-di-GMP-specific phosphodiesterase class I)
LVLFFKKELLSFHVRRSAIFAADPIVTTRLLLVTADATLRSEAEAASRRLGTPMDVMPTLEAALSWMLRPEQLCTHVLVPGSMDPQRIDALAGMVDEVTSLPTPLLLLGGTDTQGPSVLPVEEGAFAAIEQTLREHRPFVPEKMPDLTAEELRAALHNGLLRMRFQPIVDAVTFDPIGMEALARLHHPTLGILRPKDFMPQAVQSGQERTLTGIVAARAMLELRSLPGLPERNFSLNVPLTSLCHVYAVDRARELCAVVGASPDMIVIEVLETDTVPDLHVMAAAVQRWRDAGFWVTIDDAGPRLPHWRALLDLPFTGLKLDSVLAADASGLDDAARIVEAAKAHGLFVTAEGIETDAAMARMGGLGVDAMQGFLFCRPLPARAVPIWLKEWQAGLLPRPERKGLLF